MTTLAGTATYPDGSPASYGKVTVRLVASVDGLAPGYAGNRGIYGLSHAKVSTDGTWSVEGLTPNDDPALVPAGTVYEVLVQVPGRPVTVAHAALTTAGGATQQLRDVLTDPPGALPPPHTHPADYPDLWVEGTSQADVAAAIATAAPLGIDVHVPAGEYVLNNVLVTSVANLVLEDGATFLHAPGSGSGSMFNFTGTRLSITGGVVDGNKANQTGRPYIVSGFLQEGKEIEFERVHFRNTIASIVYVQKFGGLLSMQHCKVTGQAEHDGVAGHTTSILRTISGEDGGDGLVRFNHNHCVGTDAPVIAGGNPGGIFLATNGYVAGAPGSEGFAVGNLSTLEAIGNYFWGYGQNAGGNDISPIHTYPAIGGARIVGNYFERCGFCAISAKSVQNFVCTDNTIVDGLTSVQNVASEGAISYMPGYQAASIPRPRAVISGNIIDTPGGTPTEKQAGISIHGLVDSRAQQVLVANNVISGCGRGIKGNYIDDIAIVNNVINGSSGGATDEDGIRLDNCSGTVMVNGNRIRCPNGFGLYGITGMATARFHIVGNFFEEPDATRYALTLRGAAYVKVSGNTFDAAGTAVYLTASGAVKIGHLDLGQNTLLAGTAIYDYVNVTKATGYLEYSTSPQGVVVPGAVGTIYRRTNGKEGDTLWIALGTTATSWAPLLDAGSDGFVPTATVGAGAGTGATVTVTGNDVEGVIEVTTGTTPTVGAAIASLVFAQVRAAPPKVVMLTPANPNAAVKQVNVFVSSGTRATTGFALSNVSSALNANSIYQWYFRVL